MSGNYPWGFPNAQRSFSGRHEYSMMGHDQTQPTYPMSGNEPARFANPRVSPTLKFSPSGTLLGWNPPAVNDGPYPQVPSQYQQAPTLTLYGAHPVLMTPNFNSNQLQWMQYPTAQDPTSLLAHRGHHQPCPSSIAGHDLHAIPNNVPQDVMFGTKGHTPPLRHTPPAPQLNPTKNLVAIQVDQRSSGWTLNRNAREFKPPTPPLYQRPHEQHANPSTSCPEMYPTQPVSPFEGNLAVPQHRPQDYQSPDAGLSLDIDPMNPGPLSVHGDARIPLHLHSTRLMTQSFHNASSSQPQIANGSRDSNTSKQEKESVENEDTNNRQKVTMGYTPRSPTPAATLDPDWVKVQIARLPPGLCELFEAIIHSKWRVDGQLEPTYGSPIAEELCMRLGLSVTAALAGKSIYTSFIKKKKSSKPYCMICEKEISSSHALEHIRKHFRHLPFRCTYADCTVCKKDNRKAFPDFNRLTQHIKRAAPILCNDCGLSLRKESLKRHKENSCDGSSSQQGTSPMSQT